MPIRIASAYLYPIVAGLALLTGFTASVSETVAVPQAKPMFAVGEPEAGPSPVVLTWLGFAGTASVVIGKWYSDMRERRRSADMAEIKGMLGELTQARKELGDALGKSDSKDARLAELELQAASKAARVTELEAQLIGVQTKFGQIIANQDKIVAAVNKQQVKAKDTSARVTELENFTGSSSNPEIAASPPSPPVDNPTALDMPNIQ